MFRAVLCIIAAAFALAFLIPTVLTFTNSLMSQTEINAHYGMIFSDSSGGKSYISKIVNLKFIPDDVSFSQYITVLLKSPDYLFKFWNSVILVVPIVIFQIAIASLAAYAFARYQGKFRSVIFFLYTILMLMPYQVTLVPNYLISDWLNIIGTRWAIWLPGVFAPICSFELLQKAVAAAEGKHIPVKVGNIVSNDLFYRAGSDPVFDKWAKMGVLACEMEAAALYMNAAYAGVNALCIVTISDEISTGKVATPEERQTAFTNMMEIALELA